MVDGNALADVLVVEPFGMHAVRDMEGAGGPAGDVGPAEAAGSDVGPADAVFLDLGASDRVGTEVLVGETAEAEVGFTGVLAVDDVTWEDALSTPVSNSDCKAGGWRNPTNDRGQAFRNQGQCVSYVVSHRR